MRAQRIPSPRRSALSASKFAGKRCWNLKTTQPALFVFRRNRCGFADSNKVLAHPWPPPQFQVQHRLRRLSSNFAFTLLELLVVLGIVAILVVISFPISAQLRARAQRVQCSANLRNLYIATELFVQQNGSWPQIGDNDDEDGPVDFGNGWIAALKPFGISEKTWICPTVQNLLGNPDLTQNARVDYVATPFDDKPTTPHEWPTQPWFAEVGSVHGHGNLIVFTDGSISDLNTVLKNPSGK